MWRQQGNHGDVRFSIFLLRYKGFTSFLCNGEEQKENSIRKHVFLLKVNYFSRFQRNPLAEENLRAEKQIPTVTTRIYHPDLCSGGGKILLFFKLKQMKTLQTQPSF